MTQFNAHELAQALQDVQVKHGTLVQSLNEARDAVGYLANLYDAMFAILSNPVNPNQPRVTFPSSSDLQRETTLPQTTGGTNA